MIPHYLPQKRLDSYLQALREGQNLLIEGLWDAPKALLAAYAQEECGKNILILTGASREESRLYDDLPFFTGKRALDYPAWETLPSENIAPSPDIVGDRYEVLRHIHESKEPLIIIASLQAVLQKVIPPQAFDQLQLEIKVGQEIPYERLLETLEAMGFQRKDVAADKGEYAVRGGIVDIYPVSSPDPYRIEFWGDEVDSLRTYDPVAQKSVGQAGSLTLLPAQELELINNDRELTTILDYLGPKTLVVFDDLLSLEDRYVSLLKLPGGFSHNFGTFEEFLDLAQPMQRMYWSENPIEQMSDVSIDDRPKENLYSADAPLLSLSFEMFQRQLHAARWNHPFLPIAEVFRPSSLAPDAAVHGTDILAGMAERRFPELTLHILCQNDSDERHLKERFQNHEITLPEQTHWHRAYLSSGFVVPEAKVAVLPLPEITQRYKIRRQKQRSTYHSVPSEMFELSEGEHIVHLDHGVGKFLGVETRPNNEGIDTEFFLVEYANDAKLFVPLTQSHLVSKYVGTKESHPKLHTLGSNRWKKTKATTEQAIMGYASEILKVYAQRAYQGGHAYPADGQDLLSFEEEFPFIETEDQGLAIQSIKEDMTLPKCMERLVCGDVGYGKTEVAMRAAFKAVIDGGKQVAVLVPTTVLAMQHYDNFRDRMSNYPINIGVLSRFRTPKQIRETLEQAANGGVDIVIGTHRMVSKDVQFKDLGLVIIDEEQRFGVRAKEHLKKIRAGVDCLTLSATPIPRTLYLSMMGARDMSVIATPPQDRLPIKTIISENDDKVVQNALLRELTRDGQAFVIHNRVESIFDRAGQIQKLLPQARIVVGHGQMSSDELDIVFHKFKNGEADILVATSIIENGIDIPNANTIIIDRSDRFGLADLYQLRGRVGRWNRRAYAYLLVPRGGRMTAHARERLQALVEAGNIHGGGMKVAMRDLEIRGAGDILGTEQSGHVEAIGFHLYCKLLKRTIDALQGELPSVFCDTKLEFPQDARLPEDYVNAPSLRMEIYQRLGEALNLESVDAIWNELKDRFGKPPEPVLWLYYLTRIRVFAARHSFTLLKMGKVSLHAERKQGNEVVTKQCMIGKAKSPQDLEAKVIKALKKGFKIK